VIAITDGSGAIAERYVYSAYGEPVFTNASGTVLSDSAKDNRYTYTGREWDEELSLYHFRARMYDADAGRFCARDPLRFQSDGENWYFAFFGTSRMDWSGLVATPCGQDDDGLIGNGDVDGPEVLILGPGMIGGSGLEPSPGYVDPSTQTGSAATIICKDGKLAVLILDPFLDPTLLPCIVKHEEKHVAQANLMSPNVCAKPCDDGYIPPFPRAIDFTPEEVRAFLECQAYQVEIDCLRAQLQRGEGNPNTIRYRINQIEELMRTQLQCNQRMAPRLRVRID
jgi:RHS repeat-associated protein